LTQANPDIQFTAGFANPADEGFTYSPHPCPSPEMGGERLAEAKTKKQNLSKLPSINEWGAPSGNKNEEATPI